MRSVGVRSGERQDVPMPAQGDAGGATGSVQTGRGLSGKDADGPVSGTDA